METNGLLYDSKYMAKLDKYYTSTHKAMRKQLRRLIRRNFNRKIKKSFNFDSHDKIGALIHQWFKLEKLHQRFINKKATDASIPPWERKKNRDKVSTDPVDYVGFTGKGIISTDKATLKGLLAYYKMTDDQREFLELFAEYRAGRTRYSRNVKGMRRFVCPDGRVRSSLLQHGTGTSRRSSKEPNQQNIPRDALVKRGFISPKWHLFVVNDYKNLEVRIAAAKSGDEALLAAFNSGKDVHSYLGSKAYNIDYNRMVQVLGTPWDKVKDDPDLLKEYKKYGNYRNRAKIMWWVLLFGGGPDKIAGQAGIPFSEAARLQSVVYAEFPGLRDMFDDFARFADRHGYAATDFGRRRYLDNINSSNDQLYNEARRQALNTPIQGTAADITLRAVTLLHSAWRKKKIKARNVQEVHDAVTQEAHYRHVHRVITISRKIMEGITCPASKGKIKFEVDTSVGAHMGSKLKVDKNVLEMAKTDPRGLYELCRKDLDHEPEYYAA
jgi:DNA polymerase I-like protein with 3'-5' exonuclease and polymerase domains